MKSIKKWGLLTLLLVISIFSSRAQKYREYHNNVNRSEFLIFVKGEFDSGLSLYNKTFSDFDFVFLKDCVIALQIAIYKSKHGLTWTFFEKAFKNGLRVEQIQNLRYISNSDFYKKNSTKIELLYRKCRPEYLRRINVGLLNQINELFVSDQAIKNGPDGGAAVFADFRNSYRIQIREKIDLLKKLVYQFGFPLDKLIGIDQNDIMKELKANYKDLPDYFEYYQSQKNSNRITLSQFQHEERFLTSHLIFPLMHHLERAYYEFPLSFYQSEIDKGNIHPKDVGAINDFPYATLPPDPIGKDSIYYGVGVRFKAANSLCIPDSLINRNRSRLCIQKIEYDRKKWEFMYEHKMDFIFGYNGCRS